MIEGGGHTGLVKESLLGARIEVVCGEGKLERDGTPELGVFRAIDYTHATVCQRLDDPEVGNRASDEAQRIDIPSTAAVEGGRKIDGGINVRQKRVRLRVSDKELLEAVPREAR